MNELYAKRNNIPTEKTKNTIAERAVRKLIERERQSRERSKNVVDFYRDGQQKDMRM